MYNLVVTYEDGRQEILESGKTGAEIEFIAKRYLRYFKDRNQRVGLMSEYSDD